MKCNPDVKILALLEKLDVGFDCATQVMPSRNGNTFHIASPLSWESPHEGPVMRRFGIFSIVNLHKQLNQSRVAGCLRRHGDHCYDSPDLYPDQDQEMNHELNRMYNFINQHGTI